MTDSLVRFVLPAGFVLKRVLPTSAELGSGYAEGWLDGRGLIEIESARYAAGITLSEVDQRIAFLVADQQNELPDLVAVLPRMVTSTEAVPSVWLYLALAFVIEGPTAFLNRQELVDMIYADFDYPREVEPLVSYMPAPPGDMSSRTAIERRWSNYLQEKGKEYALRTAEMMRNGNQQT